MYKIIKIVLSMFVVGLLCIIPIHAQQQAELTQNIFNIYYLNPGYAGYMNSINVTATIRDQWSGFGKVRLKDKDNDFNIGNNIMGSGMQDTTKRSISPRYTMISADMPIKILNGGIGLTISNDHIGLFDNNTVKLGYTFQHQFSMGGKLGIGLQLKLDNIVLRVNEFIWGQPGDPIFSQMLSEGNDLMLDLNFGVFYGKPRSFFGGISAFNLFETHGKKTLYKFKRSFTAIAGYDYTLPASPEIKITPTIVVKTDLASYQLNASALVSYKEKFWGGVNYRISDAIGIMFGLSFKDIKLGYSYDIGISKMNLGGSFGSHEVMLSYSFDLDKNKGKITQKNTRYL